MWFTNCCSIFPAVCFSLNVFATDFADSARFSTLFLLKPGALHLTKLCFAKSWSFGCFSSTNLWHSTIPGQTSEWRPRGKTWRADPRPERDHPTHHTPDRGSGAPQLLRCQGRLSQQPGPVWLVTLAWAAHQRRRWVFRVRTCLLLLSMWLLPLKTVMFEVIWIRVRVSSHSCVGNSTAGNVHTFLCCSETSFHMHKSWHY